MRGSKYENVTNSSAVLIRIELFINNMVTAYVALKAFFREIQLDDYTIESLKKIIERA